MAEDAAASAGAQEASAPLDLAIERLGAQAKQAASANDNGEALVNLDRDYLRGFGAPQDFEAARVLFEAAARKGASHAFFNLGLMHKNGHGVARDHAVHATERRTATEKAYRRTVAHRPGRPQHVAVECVGGRRLGDRATVVADPVDEPRARVRVQDVLPRHIEVRPSKGTPRSHRPPSFGPLTWSAYDSTSPKSIHAIRPSAVPKICEQATSCSEQASICGEEAGVKSERSPNSGVPVAATVRT